MSFRIGYWLRDRCQTRQVMKAPGFTFVRNAVRLLAPRLTQERIVASHRGEAGARPHHVN